MAPQGKLVKVGREAFDILEEYLGKKEKPLSHSYRPVKMTQSKKNEAVLIAIRLPRLMVELWSF